jgi:2-polyprenyl-6-methoxyphenol hydroxylase-like FAD-dependent oxidoreductase
MSATLSKIIIVGGGPAGMTAAHALYKAGIDFVLLESRPQIDFDGGCNVILSSMGMRGLGQLGLLPDLQECSTPLTKFQRIDHDGNDIGDTWLFTFIKERLVRVSISLAYFFYTDPFSVMELFPA